MSSLGEPVISAPPGRETNLEHPEDVLHTINMATQVVCIAIVTVMVGLRVFIKVRLRNGLGFEDYTTVAGWMLFIGFCANMLVLNKYGGGYHAWDVPKSQFVNFQKASYAVTLIYVPMVFVIKIALLTVMLRIFAPDRQKVLIIWTSIIILLLYYIPAFFIKIFFCRPISAYWLGTAATGGSCLNQRSVIIADSSISIVSDLWILILPVPMLWSLQMSMMKKLRVIGILGAGGLATGFSIWRLVMMVEDSETLDTTWFWIQAVLTANAEAGIGLICACLPAVSSYIVSLKSRAENSYQSYKTHELSSWNKLSSSKKGSGNHVLTFPPSQTDQALLISRVEAENSSAELRPREKGADSREVVDVSVARSGTLRGRSHRRSIGGGVIHKDVIVEQSYEYVK
ncbi:hypothetical protein BJX76DRAFT_305009 [Aspergillus varians]